MTKTINSKYKKELSSFKQGFNRGFVDGGWVAGKESLKRRFTEQELKALVGIVWFSDSINSLRIEIAKLEKRIKEMENKK